MRVSWFNLHLWISQKDVRKLIYAKLSRSNRLIALIAHNRKSRQNCYALTILSIREQRMNILDWIDRHHMLVLDRIIIPEIIKTGNIRFLAWAKHKKLQIDAEHVRFAAKLGNLEVFKWLIIVGHYERNYIECLAVGTENIKQWIRDNRLG